MLRSGAFEWVLRESFDDSPDFELFTRSDLSFITSKDAWEAGCLALQSRMEDPKLDEAPRLFRRLNTLRGLSHEEVKQVFTRGA